MYWGISVWGQPRLKVVKSPSEQAEAIHGGSAPEDEETKTDPLT